MAAHEVLIVVVLSDQRKVDQLHRLVYSKVTERLSKETYF